MFDKKKTQLFKESSKDSNDPFVDDFASCSNYKQPREIKNIFSTMDSLWKLNSLNCLKEMVYIRTITRETVTFNGTKLDVQKGQGLKFEFFGRMLWLAVNHKSTFKKNLPVFISAGSWDDLFELMRIDLSYQHGNNKNTRVLDWDYIVKLIKANIDNPLHKDLIKKYLPTIHSKSNATTLRKQCNSYIGKYIAKRLFKGTLIEQANAYRHLKASGTAHQWQQCISKQEYDNIDFSTIHGRALSKLINSNFLANHNLEKKFSEWILSQPLAKFTGYPYELFHPVKHQYQKELINRQFNKLISTSFNSNMICVVDTSGSMTSKAVGTNSTSMDVARSMALYMSHTIKGVFNNVWLEFSNECISHTFKGNTPYEQYEDMCKYSQCGDTNPLTVAEFFVNAKNLNIPEDQFPTGAILLSDGQFTSFKDEAFTKFKEILSKSFSKEFVDKFKLILWDIPNNFYENKVPTKFEQGKGFYYISGFDPAAISFLFGSKNTSVIPRTAEELFKTAMDQDLLNMLEL